MLPFVRLFLTIAEVHSLVLSVQVVAMESMHEWLTSFSSILSSKGLFDYVAGAFTVVQAANIAAVGMINGYYPIAREVTAAF